MTIKKSQVNCPTQDCAACGEWFMEDLGWLTHKDGKWYCPICVDIALEEMEEIEI